MSANLAAKEKFLRFLARRKLRVTVQRKAIIDSVFSTDEHFTAEQLFAWSQRRERSVSRATVYRALPLLTQSGLLREMDFGKDYKFYDPNYAENPHHSHLICQDCRKIFEFDDEEIKKLEKQISRRLGFSYRAHRLEITASCDQFKRFGFCHKNKETVK